MNHMMLVLLIAAIVGAGLSGGLFFVFSNTIMKAFDRLPPAGAIASMQRINETILNPLFFVVFFGTAAISIAVLVYYVSRLHLPGASLACAGALVYLLGAIVVTMAFNVPLNNKLAAYLPATNDAAAAWKAYREPWTRWNHLRTVACALSAAAFALSLSPT